MHAIDLDERLFAQDDVGPKRIDVLLELGHGGGTDDGTGDVKSRFTPRQRERRERYAGFVGNLLILRRRDSRWVVQIPLMEAVFRVLDQATFSCVRSAAQVLSRQRSATQGRPRKKTYVEV